MIGAQTLHREPDPRTRRSMISALVASALLVAVTLGLVALKVQQVRLSYRLDGLRATRQTLDDLNRQLRVEVATLRSPARVEARARALGLAAPAREQVQLAREFVTAGTGAASLRMAQTRLPNGVGVR
jgi:cell division protein FtsL